MDSTNRIVNLYSAISREVTWRHYGQNKTAIEENGAYGKEAEKDEETQVADGKVDYSKRMGRQQQNFYAGPQKFQSTSKSP